MRQALIGFAASLTPEGVIESRYPSHFHQVISGFCLFWILELRDHMLYFNDVAFAKPLLSVADRILSFFEGHVDERGLVSGLPRQYWSYVDWAREWVSTSDHPDGGVPFAGRKSNTHTYFTLLYSYVLQQTAELCEWLDRPALSQDYRQRSQELNRAVSSHCFDGKYFTDTTVDACSGQHDLSQHVQIFAVLCGAAAPDTGRRAVLDAFDTSSPFVQMSYAMMHYAFRGFSETGLYEQLWDQSWQPWVDMLKNNLSTWEEDNVRHRSDCHAWGSLALYEYPIEVAGIKPLSPGWTTLLWEPRFSLSEGLEARIALGASNVATVTWKKGEPSAVLELQVECNVVAKGREGSTTYDKVRRVTLPMAS